MRETKFGSPAKPATSPKVLQIPAPEGGGHLHLLVFVLDELRYGLVLTAVLRVVRAVEITPLPKAPGTVLGVINLAGQVIPVVNVRRRFGLAERELRTGDQFIVARTRRRTLALVADRAERLVERSPAEIARAESLLPGLEYLRGVAKLEDGLILIHDLDAFLSLDEERQLGEVLPPTESGLARTGT